MNASYNDLLFPSLLHHKLSGGGLTSIILGEPGVENRCRIKILWAKLAQVKFYNLKMSEKASGDFVHIRPVSEWLAILASQ